jgi:hypothetical protein
MGVTQVCRNCNRPVKEEDGLGNWVHVSYRSAHAITFGSRQCELYATPVSTRCTSAYGLGTSTG